MAIENIRMLAVVKIRGFECNKAKTSINAS